MSSHVICADCNRGLTPSAPRIVHSAKGFDLNGVEVSIAFYVCGDCEYERQMKFQGDLA